MGIGNDGCVELYKYHPVTGESADEFVGLGLDQDSIKELERMKSSGGFYWYFEDGKFDRAEINNIKFIFRCLGKSFVINDGKFLN